MAPLPLLVPSSYQSPCRCPRQSRRARAAHEDRVAANPSVGATRRSAGQTWADLTPRKPAPRGTRPSPSLPARTRITVLNWSPQTSCNLFRPNRRNAFPSVRFLGAAGGRGRRASDIHLPLTYSHLKKSSDSSKERRPPVGCRLYLLTFRVKVRGLYQSIERRASERTLSDDVRPCWRSTATQREEPH